MLRTPSQSNDVASKKYVQVGATTKKCEAVRREGAEGASCLVSQTDCTMAMWLLSAVGCEAQGAYVVRGLGSGPDSTNRTYLKRNRGTGSPNRGTGSPGLSGSG